MFGHKEFRVVCTDSSAHPSRQLALFAPTPPYDDKGAWVGDANDLGMSWADWALIVTQNAHGKPVYGNEAVHSDSAKGRTWRFKCKSCGRDVQLKDEMLGVLVLGFVAAGQPNFDISTRR